MMTTVVLRPFSTHRNALIGSFPVINKKLLSIASFPLLRGEGIIKKIEFLVISISISHLLLVIHCTLHNFSLGSTNDHLLTWISSGVIFGAGKKGEAEGVRRRVGVVAVFDGHIGTEASEMASKLFLDYFYLHSAFLAYKINK